MDIFGRFWHNVFPRELYHFKYSLPCMCHCGRLDVKRVAQKMVKLVFFDMIWSQGKCAVLATHLTSALYPREIPLKSPFLIHSRTTLERNVSLSKRKMTISPLLESSQEYTTSPIASLEASPCSNHTWMPWMEVSLEIFFSSGFVKKYPPSLPVPGSAMPMA